MIVPIATNNQNAKPVSSKLIVLANAGEARHRVIRPLIPIMTHFLIVLFILHPSFFTLHFRMSIGRSDKNEQTCTVSYALFITKYIENFQNLQANVLPIIPVRLDR